MLLTLKQLLPTGTLSNKTTNTLHFVTSSNVLRKGSLQTKLNAGLSEQQQEDLLQNERSFHEVKLLTARTLQTYTASANLNEHSFCHT